MIVLGKAAQGISSQPPQLMASDADCVLTMLAVASGDMDVPAFAAQVRKQVIELAARPDLEQLIEEKRTARVRDEAAKPLDAYRDEELARMKLNFYGFDPSYHVARYHFVHRVPHAWTPLHLARHRQNMWQKQSALQSRNAA